MYHRRPSIVGPLILITIGILFLLANIGALPFTFWELAARFWPLLLILIGLEILIGRQSALGALAILVLWVALVAGVIYLSFAQGGGVLPTSAAITDQLTQPLGDIKSATVNLEIGTARTLVKSLGSDSSNLMEGIFRHAEGTRVVKTYNAAGSEGRLGLKEEGVNFMIGGTSVSQWDVGLNPSVPIALRVNGGIGRATLDLASLNVTALNVDTGVGSLEITLPKSGAAIVRVNGGVGSTTLTFPQGVAARIRVNGGLGGTHVDESRFPKSGDVYQSADYASATNKMDIDVDGGVGSINIR